MRIAAVNNNYNSTSQQKQPAFRSNLGDTFAGGLKGLYGWYERAYGLKALQRMIAKDQETTQIAPGFLAFFTRRRVPRTPVIERLKALVVKAPNGTIIHPTLEIAYRPEVSEFLVIMPEAQVTDIMPKAQAAEETKEQGEKLQISKISRNFLEDLYRYYKTLIDSIQAKQDAEIAVNEAVAKTMGTPAK